MSYIKQSLSNGERIEAEFKIHWINMVAAYVLIVIGLLFTVGGVIIKDPIAIAIPALILLLGIWNLLKLKFTENCATNRRVVVKTGVIGRHTEEMRLDSIETVEIRQGVMGRIFGYGTVKVTGKGVSDLNYLNIDDPIAVKKRIEAITYEPR